MSDYKKVMAHLREQCEEIKGEWDGDQPGVKEERAQAADELLKATHTVDLLVKELENNNE